MKRKGSSSTACSTMFSAMLSHLFLSHNLIGEIIKIRCVNRNRMRWLVLFLLLTHVYAVGPLLSMTRRIQYFRAAPLLPCGICKEALYLQSARASTAVGFVHTAGTACTQASSDHPTFTSHCTVLLKKHAAWLVKGTAQDAKENCFRTKETDCVESSPYHGKMFCDHKRSCRVMVIE